MSSMMDMRPPREADAGLGNAKGGAQLLASRKGEHKQGEQRPSGITRQIAAVQIDAQLIGMLRPDSAWWP